MAYTNTKPTAHTRVLHFDKDTQTQTSRSPDHIWLWRPHWKNFGISWSNSYIKDTTDFINFIENSFQKKPFSSQWMLLASTIILQEESTQIVCKAHGKYYQNNPPVPTEFLRQMLQLFLKENSFKLTNKSHLNYQVVQWQY